MDDVPLPVASGFVGVEGARLYYEVFGAGRPLVLLPEPRTEQAMR